MTLPPGLTPDALLEVGDPVERAHLLARTAHQGQFDKAGVDYYTGHLRDVWARAVDDGAGPDDQAAALLHDVVEDRGVTDEDLWLSGFSDRTLLVVHLLTKVEGQDDGAAYARLRAYEPARRLKLHADVASNSDPERLALLDAPTRERLTAKYAATTRALALPGAAGDLPTTGHTAGTTTERRGGVLVWLAACTCGWRGTAHADELAADTDRWAHSA